jgi:hypothetical protein
MSDFNVRSDSVDVEQIMRQIRARIREKRGADYTEAEVQQLARVKLEKFLDPRGVRSDLVEQFRRREYTPSPPLRKLQIEPFSIYGTHRGFLRWTRQLLQPILKLFMNPNPLIHFVWTQAESQAAINGEIEQWMRRREQLDAKMDPLYFELLHNMVVELTRTGIEVHNLKMRVESLSSRLEFDERRGRSLERVVEYRPGALQRGGAPSGAGAPVQTGAQLAGAPGGESRPEGGGTSERRRRRRRRRRRPGQTMADRMGDASGTTSGAPPEDSGGPETGQPYEPQEEGNGGEPDEIDDEASDQ